MISDEWRIMKFKEHNSVQMKMNLYFKIIILKYSVLCHRMILNEINSMYTAGRCICEE